MAKRIEKTALEFFKDPQAAQNMIDAHNELVDCHNNLTEAVDDLLREFREQSELVDQIVDAVFEVPGELDS